MDRPRYGDDDFDYVGLAEWEAENDRHSRPATISEAHAEWHLNAGVPMGQPGCPWDACHVDLHPDWEPEEDALWAHETMEPREEPDLDPDDLPF